MAPGNHPEVITLGDRRYVLAGFWRRIASALADSVIAVMLPVAILWSISFLDSRILARGGLPLCAAILIVATWGYYWRGNAVGQTLGKRLFRIRLVDGDGRVPGRRTAFKRVFWMWLGGDWAWFDYLLLLGNRRRQTFHDQRSGTYVVEAE